MKKLATSEIYKLEFLTCPDFLRAVKDALPKNTGVIYPENIESVLIDLKTRSKTASFAFLTDILTAYEKEGKLRPFNLAKTETGAAKIPISVPYVPAKGAAWINGGSDSLAMYINMYHIGGWSADGTLYKGLAAITDLYSCLEGGYIGYRLLLDKLETKAFTNKLILEYLTRIYTYMFAKAIIKTKAPFGGSGFNEDAGTFLIAKFFLLYILERPADDTTDDYAYLTIRNQSSLVALKNFEELSAIDYSSLSGFLASFGKAFFNGQTIYIAEFLKRWVSLYGENTGLAVEYVPYFLHFLFAALHGALLGGTLRLTRDLPNLIKLGLPRLYNAVVDVLK